ncbi:MAG: TIGR01212 family radical SAM protein, partial [Clostridia bacterium]|nr:TIGR01212 family radical SAM protein [Clostridia bacterium]
LINRGHDFAAFEDGYRRLRRLVPGALICVHIILGLPGEDGETMMRTVRDVAALHPDQVKIHLLHVLKNTPMASMLLSGEYVPLIEEEYVSLVCRALTLLPPDTVVARVTGDGLADDLLAPLWSRRKTCVINDIDKKLFAEGWYQGCFCEAGK